MMNSLLYILRTVALWVLSIAVAQRALQGCPELGLAIALYQSQCTLAEFDTAGHVGDLYFLPQGTYFVGDRRSLRAQPLRKCRLNALLSAADKQITILGKRADGSFVLFVLLKQVGKDF